MIAGKGDAPGSAAAVRGTCHRVFLVDCGRRRPMLRLIPTAPRPFLPCPSSWRWCSCSDFLTSPFPDRSAPAGNFARVCQQRIFAFWPSAPDSPLPAGGPWLWSCLVRLSDYKGRDHPSLAKIASQTFDAPIAKHCCDYRELDDAVRTTGTL